MKGLMTGLAVAAIITFGLMTRDRADAAIVYNLAADWSDTQNPNGVWSYNKAIGVPLTDHLDDEDPTHMAYLDPQPAWASAPLPQPGHCPWWLKVVSRTQPVAWDVPLGSVNMHGVDSCDSVAWPGVTWTSPIDGTASISGGLWTPFPKDPPRLMAWQVLRDADVVTGGILIDSAGYNSSNELSFANGSGGAAALCMPVSVGTVITLQLDRNGACATVVGVDLTITANPIPEPSTLVLLGVGGIALMVYAWRRRTWTIA